MFQLPALITMSIAATRMYRSLGNFYSSDISQGCMTSETMQISTTAISALDRMEATMHTHSKQYAESQSQASQ